jgi:hypothetical protein
MGHHHGQKNSFSQRKLASPNILHGNTLNKYCFPPIATNHKQINKPWHPTVTGGTTMQHYNGDGRHDNGDARTTTRMKVTGDTTTAMWKDAAMKAI